MNKFIRTSMILAMLGGTFSSCEKLEVSPVDQVFSQSKTSKSSVTTPAVKTTKIKVTPSVIKMETVVSENLSPIAVGELPLEIILFLKKNNFNDNDFTGQWEVLNNQGQLIGYRIEMTPDPQVLEFDALGNYIGSGK